MRTSIKDFIFGTGNEADIKLEDMTIEKRLENALRISENIKDGKICPNNLYDLQLHLSDALMQVQKITNDCK